MDSVHTLRRELTCALGLDVPPRRTRRSSSLARCELQRALTSAPSRRAPWAAPNWRPAVPLSSGELDRRVWLARDALAAYDAANRAPRNVPPRDERADAQGDAALLARAYGVLTSTLAVDVADEKLAALGAASQTRRRETYERWDTQLYRPLAQEIADAVDGRAREWLRGGARRRRGSCGGGGGGGGGAQSSSRQSHSSSRSQAPPPPAPTLPPPSGGSLVIRPAVPLTLRDPMKRVLLKQVEEDALTQPVGRASLELPRARARELLHPTFWSPQALNSTPHGYTTRQRSAAAAASAAADAAPRSVSRVFHDDYGCSEQPTDSSGRLVDVDAEFPVGKRVAYTKRATRATLDGGAPRGRSAPPRPVGGRATVRIE